MTMMRAKHIVRVAVDAPVGVDVADLINRLVGSGLHVATQITEDPEGADYAEDAEAALDLRIEQAVAEVQAGTEYDGGPVCVVDFDSAVYYGDENDGVYFDVAKGCDGKWYSSAVVDCDSGGFTDGLHTDAGPFGSAERALHAGYDVAAEWCSWNDVFDCEDYDDMLARLARRARFVEDCNDDSC